MSNQANLCRHCRQPIPESAGICYLCKRSQGYISAKLESLTALVTIGSMILSIALVTLSWLQFREASKQRISAEQAVNNASNALRQANAASGSAQNAETEAKNAKGKAEQARDEARNAVEHLRGNIKLMLEMEYLTPNIVDGDHYDAVKIRRVQQELEEFAVPDNNERKKWLKSLGSKKNGV